MKILSNEKLKKELDEILNYNINDIVRDEKDMDTMRGNNLLNIVECPNINSEDNDIIIDYEDINTMINNKDLLAMSDFEYCCDSSAKKAIKSTILDFEENSLSLIEADAILVCFEVNLNYEMMEITDAMGIIYDKWSHIFMTEEPDVIFGVSCNNDFEDDYTKVTVFVSYSKKEKLLHVNNRDYM